MSKNNKISPRDVFYANPQISYPQLCDDNLYWLQPVMERDGAAGLYKLDMGSSGAQPELISPAGTEPKSKVHEYGGRPYLATVEHVYFANASDQQIHCLTIATNDLRQVTDENKYRYTNFVLSADSAHLICVAERVVKEAVNENMIVAFSLDKDISESSFTVLASGADFYAGLAIDTEGQQLAWFEWDHPNMPWDTSRLVLSQYLEDPTLSLSTKQVLVDLPDTSVCQTHFTVDGALVFAIDGQIPTRKNSLDQVGGLLESWQLLQWKNNHFTRLTFDDCEYGAPFWVFGEYRLANIVGGLAAIRTSNGNDCIVEVASDAQSQNVLSGEDCGPFNVVQQLISNSEGRLCALAGSADQPLGVWSYKHQSSSGTICWQRIVGPDPLLKSEEISHPRHFEYPTRDGEGAYAYYYAPIDSLEASCGSPPMVVMVHGGPTANATGLYDPLKQFWTSHGYAVLDVNHRGSTGYGREFRQSLLGGWGNTDVNDVIDAIDYAIANKWASKDKLFVRGKSAGGYVVLRLLTEYGEYFSAGACYYGIGNLAVLAEDTHKFEMCYSDQLLGKSYDAKSAAHLGDPYFDRSPVNFLDKMQCPLIVFQGSEDRVVPPSLAHNLVTVLEQKNIIHEYVEYSGEGHGFKDPKNGADALRRELDFFSATLAGHTTN